MEGFNTTKNVGFSKFLLPMTLNTNPVHTQQLMPLSKPLPGPFPSPKANAAHGWVKTTPL